MKYLVMECHEAYAVVLDDEGRFLKVANLHYEVGDSLTSVYPTNAVPIENLIEDLVEDQVDEKPKLTLVLNKNLQRLALALAGFAILLLGGFKVNETFFATYGLVQMDINPSVRLSVSSKDYVTGIEGLNAEGLVISEGISFRGKKVEEVTESLVKSAIDKGYLAQGGRIKIQADAEDDQWEALAEARIAQVLERYEEDLSIEIQIGDFPDPSPSDDQDDDDDYEDRVVIPIAPIKETPNDQPSRSPSTNQKPSRPGTRQDDDDDDDWDDEDDDDWDDEDEDDADAPMPVKKPSSSIGDNDDDDDDGDWGDDDWDDDDD